MRLHSPSTAIRPAGVRPSRTLSNAVTVRTICRFSCSPERAGSQVPERAELRWLAGLRERILPWPGSRFRLSSARLVKVHLHQPLETAQSSTISGRVQVIRIPLDLLEGFQKTSRKTAAQDERTARLCFSLLRYRPHLAPIPGSPDSFWRRERLMFLKTPVGFPNGGSR